MTMRWSGLVLAAAMAMPVAGLADEIEDTIGAGLDYYREGDIAGAISELQFAIGDLQAKLADSYAETFPDAPGGWTAEEASTEGGAAFMGGGTIVNRSYREEGGNGSMTAQLMIDNPMIQGFAAMMNNPAMMAAQPNAKRVRIGRENAILNFDENAGSGEITLVLGGRAMLKIEGRKLASGDVLQGLLEAWDLRALKDAAGL